MSEYTRQAQADHQTDLYSTNRLLLNVQVCVPKSVCSGCLNLFEFEVNPVGFRQTPDEN